MKIRSQSDLRGWTTNLNLNYYNIIALMNILYLIWTWDLDWRLENIWNVCTAIEHFKQKYFKSDLESGLHENKSGSLSRLDNWEGLRSQTIAFLLKNPAFIALMATFSANIPISRAMLRDMLYDIYIYI